MEVVRALAQGGVDIDRPTTENGTTPLQWAMLDHTTPLHAAAYQGHTQVVLLLLEMRAESYKTTDLGVTPLQWATSKGHTETVHLLIKATVDTNRCSRQGGATVLHSAAEEGNVDMVRLLVMGGGQTDAVTTADGSTPLHAASRHSHTAVVRLLLELRAATRRPEIMALPALPLFILRPC